MVDKVQYDLLLDRIYDAALDPRRWTGVLDSLNTMLKSRGFAIFFQDRAEIRFNDFMGLDSSAIEAYIKHYGGVNPWVPAFARQPDKIIAHELMDRRELEGTEFFNDWLNPLGLHDAIGMPIRRDGGTFFLVSGLRDKKAGFYSAADRNFALRITPHLKRAVDIYERLHTAQFVRDGLVQGMDKLDVGVLLLDAESRILFSNRIAEAILKKGDALASRRGRLRATDAAAADELDRAVRAAAATGTRRGGEAGGVVVLRRKNGKPMTALVAPRRSEIDFSYHASSAMVFVSNPESGGGLDENHAARIYGLSGAEARLLKALLSGTRLSDYADKAGITLNTAKGYLKQIFHKTSTSRQADLLRLFFADPVLRIASGAKGRG